MFCVCLKTRFDFGLMFTRCCFCYFKANSRELTLLLLHQLTNNPSQVLEMLRCVIAVSQQNDSNISDTGTKAKWDTIRIS